jgi:oxygen-independent coproporphyrinogen-3 oxidase
LNNYLETLEKGALAISRGQKMHSLDRLIRDVLLGIKLNFLDLNYFRTEYGFSLETLAKQAIQELLDKEFIQIQPTRLELTFEGMLQGDYTGKYLARALLDQYGS